MRLWAVLLVAAVVASTARASAGDEDAVYRSCVAACVAEDEDGKAGTTLPLMLRVLRWSWEDNCRYECMHRVVAERIERGESVQQYHGKWPFVRIGGIQEPAAVLFSLANLAGYFVGFPAYWAAVKRDDFFSMMWVGYCVCGVNAWVWSAVFHTRDTLLTERMDYFSAALLNFAGAFCALVRVLEVRSRRARLALGLLVAALYVAHIGYLSLVTFDYGWNMLVNILVSAVAGVLWMSWAAVKRAPYAWRAVVTIAMLSTAMSLELLDFPPLAWALDAHALWHAATVPTMLMWYRFLTADAQARASKAD